MSPLPLFGYVLLVLPAVYLAGVLHELTHAGAVALVGGRIEEVSLSPTDLGVAFEAPTETRAGLVALAPFVLAPVVAVVTWELVKTAPWPWVFPALGFVAGFVPWSLADYRGVGRLLNAVRR
jgi:di/tricarboxylate transporter